MYYLIYFIIIDIVLVNNIASILYERQKGLTGSHAHAQLDPFAFKLTICRPMSHLHTRPLPVCWPRVWVWTDRGQAVCSLDGLQYCPAPRGLDACPPQPQTPAMEGPIIISLCQYYIISLKRLFIISLSPFRDC